jgi:4-aminobutyrate aminotransferase / (S)-3-amino-2-methylpropionate transaminase / 5-aminovalerate transaminase
MVDTYAATSGGTAAPGGPAGGPVGGPTLPQRRLLRTEVPGPRSRELVSRRAAAVPSGVGTALPVFVERAGGGVLVDVDGNSLIDLGSGIAVVNVGNASPDVVAAVQAQVARFTHTCFMITPYEGYVAVCEELNRRTPGEFEKRSMLVNSGAEAVENAVKIARAYTGRPAVVAFDHAYHGRTLLTMTLTAKNRPYKHSFGPFAPEVYRVPMAYPFRWPGGPERCADEAYDRFVEVLTTQIGPENVACVVVEPIQGEGGFVVPAEGFLPRIGSFCAEHGIVLVADEVQTGFGRTGYWFAAEHEGLAPDLVATAKGIAGGLPLGGVTGRAEVMDAVHVSGLGGTFGGNPVACAAALGAIATIERDGLVKRARRIGEIMRPRLEALAERYDVVGDVRGRGAMQAVELVMGRDDLTPNPTVVADVVRRCAADGVVVLTAGTFGNVLRFLPPLVIGEDLLLDALDVLDAAFAAAAPVPVPVQRRS